jgi:hypothetical protein
MLCFTFRSLDKQAAIGQPVTLSNKFIKVIFEIQFPHHDKYFITKASLLMMFEGIIII